MQRLLTFLDYFPNYIRDKAMACGKEIPRDRPAETGAEITPEMISAGEAVLADLAGEVSRAFQAREVFLAMRKMQLAQADQNHLLPEGTEVPQNIA
jgi:hypothetical protein